MRLVSALLFSFPNFSCLRFVFLTSCIDWLVGRSSRAPWRPGVEAQADAEGLPASACMAWKEPATFFLSPWGSCHPGTSPDHYQRQVSCVVIFIFIIIALIQCAEMQNKMMDNQPRRALAIVVLLQTTSKFLKTKQKKTKILLRVIRRRTWTTTPFAVSNSLPRKKASIVQKRRDACSPCARGGTWYSLSLLSPCVSATSQAVSNKLCPCLRIAQEKK